ncbi:diguanylate cyclase (GGDEF)-like protein [Actinoalloteichus hoggarensis]|uniref:Phytochrome-like protein cph2 n=1 Tax=Actinoalloteichus hoggarensis TaxID=1470176 RepID=A0A221W409_9PSEU|nr:EAL domain-containing protein [Actinoalloteichus hoggarensis]ASO20413.1 Phytochrome-like protein cph2 [Actinoalloteichus hoggarensis]MBB5923452.1 diguanylate cyclase (GGDEF)-like protein [Actinoalloteichus hoggarensis]
MTDDEAVRHAVLQNADVGFGVADARGRLQWLNAALARLLGVTEAQGVGVSLPALLPGIAEAADGLPWLSRIAADGAPPRWIEVVCLPLPGTDHRLLYRAMDVTRWREQELVRTDASTRRSPVVGKVGNWEWFVGEDRVVWSDGMREMSGHPADAELDYSAFLGMVHPEDLPLVERTLSRALRTGEPFTYIHRALNADPDADERIFECFGEVFHDRQGVPVRLVGSAHDITQAHQVHVELRKMAEEDPLTGLPNRRSLTRELESQLAVSTTGSLLLIDLDNFKDVNDLRGHKIGDQVMCTLAATLRDRMEDRQFLARLGGDEFAVVMPEVDAAHARAIAQRLAEAVAAVPIDVAGAAIRITISTGVAPFASGHGWEAVLANADLALYASKAAGRNRVTVYDPAHYADTAKRVDVLERVRTALGKGHLALHAMPMVNLRTGRTLGYELLLRLEDQQLPRIGPAEFLPDAERTDLVLEIDRWVLGQAIDALAVHRDPAFRLDVNVSARTLDDEDFCDFVLDRLAAADITQGRFGIEITETAAMTNLDAARDLSLRLRDAGCRITLDDFGSGFGSFVHLKHLPVTGLKIDGEFVRAIDHGRTDAVLVTGMMEIANGLGLSTVAEWVERPSQVEALMKLGVDVAQGFHLGRPAPLTDLLARPNGVLPL